MAKTHDFTKNTSGEPITVVLDQIQTIERDNFSDCTTITLIGGNKIAVSESVKDVKGALENA